MRTTTYPRALREDLVEVLHGHFVADPYRWLEDPSSEATAEWMLAQDVLWRAQVSEWPSRDALRERALALADAGTVTAPVWRNGRRFVLRRSPGELHPVLYADGTVVVDPGALDPTGGTVLDSWDPSPDGSRVAVQLSRGGTEEGALYVLDVATGEVLGAPVAGCRYASVAWLSEDAFYYVHGEHVRLRRVMGDDVAVFGAEGHLGLGISHDGRWLVVSTAGLSGVELRLADLLNADQTSPALRPVPGAVVGAVAEDGRLYLVIPGTDGPSIAVASPRSPDRWQVLVPADPEAVLADFTVLADVLLVTRIREGVSELVRHDRETGAPLDALPLPGSGSVGRLSAEGGQAWFTYTDTVTPPQVWHFDGSKVTLWETAPGRVVIPAIETRELTATSADGTPVRLTVLALAGTGPRPTILHGYGGFGLPMTPGYAADALAWIEAGGVLAIAHLRGGAGSHQEGVREHKQRVFDDFLAAAQLLIDAGWTTPEQLGLWGESNGGLLVAAALTQRPDVFAAVVCASPILDMVRYELFGLGPVWAREYGSASDPSQLATLLDYSPYHRVEAGTAYPATLFATFANDTRVDPLHARKMCAALQWATVSNKPILLRHEAEAGHGDRATDRAATLVADLLAFLAVHTGLQSPRGEQRA